MLHSHRVRTYKFRGIILFAALYIAAYAIIHKNAASSAKQQYEIHSRKISYEGIHQYTAYIKYYLQVNNYKYGEDDNILGYIQQV